MNVRILLVIALLLIASVAAGWWYIAGQRMEIRISEADIRKALGPRFPLSQTHFLVLQVELDAPRLSLRELDNRIALGVDARLNLRVGGQRDPLGASIDLESGLRYVAGEGQFFLDQPVVTQLDVSGMPADWQDRARDVLGAAAIAAATRGPVYALKATDAKQATARMVLRDLRVEGKELVVTLGL